MYEDQYGEFICGYYDLKGYWFIKIGGVFFQV